MCRVDRADDRLFWRQSSRHRPLFKGLCPRHFAKTIGEREGLDGETQTALEAVAVLHNIACPLCRER
ncbi:hypothetical protein HMPREF0262_00820 [Clostridium sp. ATCC 29733]|nr:hypothetical protein HMPREF0262_00820 [Clostridium sp. ATCC 29733]